MSGAGKLSKACLSWEPVRMVTLSKKRSSSIGTLELSVLDILNDFYNSVLLVYDCGGQVVVEPEPVISVAERLQRALEELLEHQPCAAGVLLPNPTDGRLEVRYPTVVDDDDGAHAQSKEAAAAAALPFGVPFHVAYAAIPLSHLGDVSDLHPSFDLLYPCIPTPSYDSTGRPNPRFIMAFQVTSFKCGGFTIGYACSHTYADGYTVSQFLQNLCSISRGAGLQIAINPKLHGMPASRVQVFFPREPPTPSTRLLPHLTRYIRARKPADEPHKLHYLTATRFVFTMEALDALRAHVISGQSKNMIMCSRNQALLALLWSAYARLRLLVRALPGSEEMALHFAVNLRRRGMFPNLPDEYIGNAAFPCSVYATLQELCESPLAHVVDKIKSAMETMHLKECVQSMIDHAELQLRAGLIPSKDLGLAIPSLVRLSLYDTDCGWGAPAYVGRPSAQLSDRCIIMDHPAARAWNVLVVFPSPEERACFQQTIAPFITCSLANGRPPLAFFKKAKL